VAVLASAARVADSAAAVSYMVAKVFLLESDANFSASAIAEIASFRSNCSCCLSEVSPVTCAPSP
jgi:hypothetical protein